MSKGKLPGNLRDFRIDGRPSDDAASPQNASAQNLSQNTRTRASSMQEWNPGSGVSSEIDELWPEWKEDAGVEVNLSKNVTPPSASRPLAPKRRELPSTTLHSPENPPALLQSDLPLKGESLGRAQPWAVELALEERRMEHAGVVDFTNTYQKQELLKIRTREFASMLQESFRQHVELFNESRRSASHALHIYKVSNADGDFMLFRNGVKLVVSGQRAGRILFAFNQYLGQIFAPTQNPVVEIEASWGPFDQLFWSYKGERIQVLDLVRYFLTEFVRQSYR